MVEYRTQWLPETEGLKQAFMKETDITLADEHTKEFRNCVVHNLPNSALFAAYSLVVKHKNQDHDNGTLVEILSGNDCCILCCVIC